MPTLGNIDVPVIEPLGTFPFPSDFPFGRVHQPKVVTHRFNSANAKIEQRFLMGNGAKLFPVRRNVLDFSKKAQLREFWEGNLGGYGAFTYNYPLEDGSGFEAFVVRFQDPTITFEYLSSAIAHAGIVLVEIPQVIPAYALIDTVTRFPTDALEEALLAQEQTIIPLVKIIPTATGYPAIYIADRDVDIGAQRWQARLLEPPDGIEQGMGGESDVAQFLLGNADRVMTLLANDVDLFKARIEFSLFHVNTGIKIDFWAGSVTDWTCDAGPVFKLTAADGFYELNLPYPTRRVSRTCWKVYNGGPGQPCDPPGVLNPLFPMADAGTCDKGFDSANGCQAHSNDDQFGGIVAKPQGVRTLDNSTGFHGLGRASLTSVSLISDTAYQRVVPEVYCNIPAALLDTTKGFPLNGIIVSGRDEGDFYTALAVACEGPIGDFTGFSQAAASQLLDGIPNHGWPTNNYGLRLGRGHDPVQNHDPDNDSDQFSLGQGGAGIQTYGNLKAAGTAFVEIRKSDVKGLQLSQLSEHSMQISIRVGMDGFVWTAPGARTVVNGLVDPIWIAVNMIIRARGLRAADAATQEQYFDVQSAIDMSTLITSLTVPKLIGDGTETQFRFTGILADEKPLRDWIQEVLNNCLGFYSFAFGKMRFGIRENSSAVEAFTEGNIIFRSLQLSPVKPTFNRIIGNFADEEYNYQGNTVEVYDIDHATLIGGATTPLFLKSQLNLAGVTSKSQCARVVTTRMREELGGINADQWKAAREISFKTTVLALNCEPGQICSLTHPDMPTYPPSADGQPEQAGYGEFRVTKWRLNKDWSIDIQGRSTHNDVYNLVFGPKPADVVADPVPGEEEFAPADWSFRAYTLGDGLLKLNRFQVRTNPDSVHQALFDIYYVDEATGNYGTIVGSITDSDEDITVSGHPLIEGKWLQCESEIMEVRSNTPSMGFPGFWDVNVKRGALGTVAVAHNRIFANISAKDSLFPNRLVIDPGLAIRPGSRLVVNDGGGPPFDQYPIASYDPQTGECIMTLELLTADPGDQVYSDPRAWLVDVKRESIAFQPRFFKSAGRANFEHTVDMRFKSVAIIIGVLTNTRGLYSEYLTVFPVSAGVMQVEEINSFQAAFPHRIRCLDTNAYRFTHPSLGTGAKTDIFNPLITAEAQPWEKAYVDVAGGETGQPLDQPPSVAATVPTVQSTGTITIGGTVDNTGRIHVVVSGSNDLVVPVWQVIDFAVTTTTQAAAGLTDWLNGDVAFSAYFLAKSSANVVTVTDRTGIGGTIEIFTSGAISAAATGLTSSLGIMIGRKYAVAFRDNADTYLSELSPLSLSTGPTGGAQQVNISDIPIPKDSRVDEVWLYATPDGREEPQYRVAIIAAGTEFASDSTLESDLASQPEYSGATQPARSGDITLTVKKNNRPWFNLYVGANRSRSNIAHGFALDPLENGGRVTVDSNNAAGAVEVTLSIQ